MSGSRVLTILGRAVECAGGCGALVVGEFTCAGCRVREDDLREKARMRLYRAMAREQLGLLSYEAAAPAKPHPVFDRSGAVLGALAIGSVLTAGMALAGLVWLGRAAILWLLEVSA